MGGEPPRPSKYPSLDTPSPSSPTVHVVLAAGMAPALALAVALARRLRGEGVEPRIVVDDAAAVEAFPAGSAVTVIDYDALNFDPSYFDARSISTRYFVEVHAVAVDPAVPLRYDGRVRVPVRVYGSVIEAARALGALPSRDPLAETMALAAAVAARDRLALRYAGPAQLANLPMIYYLGFAEFAMVKSRDAMAGIVEEAVDDPSAVELLGYRAAERLAGWARCVAESGAAARRGPVLLVDLARVRGAGCRPVDAAATWLRPPVAALEVLMLREGAQAAVFISQGERRSKVGYVVNWLSPVEPPRPAASPLGPKAEASDLLQSVTPGVYAEVEVRSGEEARLLWAATAGWLADYYVQPWRLRYDETVFAQLEK